MGQSNHKATMVENEVINTMQPTPVRTPFTEERKRKVAEKLRQVLDSFMKENDLCYLLVMGMPNVKSSPFSMELSIANTLEEVFMREEISSVAKAMTALMDDGVLEKRDLTVEDVNGSIKRENWRAKQ